MLLLIHFRHHLLKHHVNAGHAHVRKTSKIMAGAASKPPMGIVILNNMADVGNLMGFTPVSDLPRKALGQLKSGFIHIVIPHMRRPFSCFVPQLCQIFQECVLPPFFQAAFQFLTPGNKLHIFSQPCLKIIPGKVGKFRFIRKESLENSSEFFSIMVIMGLIYPL